jgi:hypothetical protein
LAEQSSLKFAAGRSLLKPDPPSRDVRLQIVLSHDGRTGEAAKHGDLADVIERIRNWALE